MVDFDLYNFRFFGMVVEIGVAANRLRNPWMPKFSGSPISYLRTGLIVDEGEGGCLGSILSTCLPLPYKEYPQSFTSSKGRQTSIFQAHRRTARGTPNCLSPLKCTPSLEPSLLKLPASCQLVFATQILRPPTHGLAMKLLELSCPFMMEI